MSDTLATRAKNETGNKYGLLTVITRDKNAKNGQAQWLCKCDCGEESVVSGSHLRSGHTASCGCKQANRHGYGEASLHNLYLTYKSNARRYSRVWELSEAQFAQLTSSSCYYCDTKPSQILHASGGKSYGAYTYNGIDRLDNSLGYLWENCVSCCGTCNIAKQGMSYKEFISWLGRVHDKHYNN